MMKLNKLLFYSLISLLVISCSGGGGGGGGTTTPTVTLTSIAVTPADQRLLLETGATKQFTATGTYSDSSTQDITTSVTWSSSNTDIATISNTSGSNGLVTLQAVGATTITATSGSINGSTLLTVETNNNNNDNHLTITVNGDTLCTNAYPNKPCVSVTVCTPGSNTDCQIINDILLDTGASGLRIFSSVLTITPTQVTSGSGNLADCIQYADGSADWGPVQTVDVILGNEPAVTMPIHVIDSTFGTNAEQIQSLCGTPDVSPNTAGFNGLLGVGLFAQDCGSTCVSVTSNQMYYSCSGSVCSPTAVPLSNQVPNPVALLPLDNNGVVVELPSVALGGKTSIQGDLYLGIDTRSNNSSSGATMYPADPSSGNFITVFPVTGGNTYSSSFIDTGSNALFFDAGSQNALITCSTGIATGWYCPSSTLSFTATTKGYLGSPAANIPFSIGNADTLFSPQTNWVFSELGAPYDSSTISAFFDWGLPFFMGRSVYVGLEKTSSNLGKGPYWAY
ncbi:MAG TPA: DUF3443 family protein [Smithella sp.]|nr:DUF3443 family protein [Smithella sp.]